MCPTRTTRWLDLSDLASRKITHRRRPAFRRLWLELLEDRTVLSTFTVTNTGDNGGVNPLPGTGTGTLRQAIVDADASGNGTAANPDLIQFDIPGSGMQTISLAAALPTITDTVFINGYSQPGSSANTLPNQGPGAGDNAVQLITLDGSQISSQADGLTVAVGGSTVQGLDIQNFSNGIHLTTNGNDTIAGNNFTNDGPNIGTDILVDNVPNNTIGGTNPAARNMCADGLTIQGPGATCNVVEGSYIGTNGCQVTADFIGVFVINASNNVIGGTALGAGNVIASNNKGIQIDGDDSFGLAAGNLVQGNYIGLNAAGTAALPGLGNRGIEVGNNYSSYTGPSGPGNLLPPVNNIIGGTDTNAPGRPLAGGGNVIAGWSSKDVWLNYVATPSTGGVVEGNYIGTNAAGTAAIGPPLTEGSTGIFAGHGDSVISDNLISGLGVGMDLGTADQVQGNLIGTDATGTQPIPNGVGVATGANGFTGGDLIGGMTPGTGNIIAFNNGPAIEVFGTGDTIEGNSIYGNTSPAIDELGQYNNGQYPFNVGPTLAELNSPGGPFTGTNNATFSDLTLTQTGSTLTYSGTLIDGLPETQYLVTLDANDSDGNYWGSDYTYLTTDASGQDAFTISFDAPPGFPINPGPLSLPASALANPPHSLGNYEQNYPVLSAAESGSTVLVSGTLNGQANTTFTVDVYANPTEDPSGYGQGQYYLGATTVTTDATGNVSFAADFSAANLPNGVLPAGWYLSTTATDPNGNTSQFSADIQATASSQTFTQGITQSLQAAINTPSTPAVTIQATPATAAAVAAAIEGVTVPQNTSVNVYVNLAPGSYTAQTVNVPSGMTLYINGTPGTTIDPATPAFTVSTGNVVVSNVTFVTTGDAPTILVSGGSLTLLDDIIRESSGYTGAAIAITGGALNLGTAASPGGNTINVNAAGSFVSNATANPVPTNDDTFEINGGPVAGPSLSFTALTSSQLAFTEPPTSSFAGFNLNNPGGVQVSVEDQLGDVETGNTSTVTVAITSGPKGGAFLSGSITAVAAQSGVAAFTNLAFNLSGTYTLKATDGSLTIATATVVILPNTGVLLLDPTGQSLTVSGNADLDVTNDGAIVIDSSNTAAVNASGNASITASEIDVTGGLSTSGNAAVHGVVNKGAVPVADPLANLAAPSQPATQYTDVNYSGTLQPGTYVGGITVSGNDTVTLQSGIYYLKGGGLTVRGNATLTGTAVLLYITGLTGSNPISINLSGNANVTLTPLTSGMYQGVVIFQDRTSHAAIDISGNAALNSTGTEYAPGATVTLSGNDDTDNPTHTSLGSQWIVDDLVLSGNAHFSITADANNRSQDPNAFLVAGGPVNPSAPVASLTPGEADAAFEEALTLWAAAGLDAGTLQVLSQTKIVITSLPAPYLGLAAPGVIELDPTAEGYGWFTDASPTATPLADQIDLLTVMTHELGHLFGLMDGNGTALMAPTLAAGVRILPDASDLLAPHTTLTTFPMTTVGTDATNLPAGLPPVFGSESGIAVQPRAATHFSISGPSSVKWGNSFSIIVTALDAYGNVATGYTGTIKFTDSVSGATLPSDYTFTATDAGVHTFTGLKLKTKGKQTITITDALDSIVADLTITVD